MSENTSIRDKALLYHLTCLNNLPNILETGLRSRASLSDDFIDVADGNIIQGREAKTLEQMVPLFVWRSVFPLILFLQVLFSIFM
ncbi:DarT ssDNA thymidine ADP-ribosyltransferase family protein [Proteus alimentorum]|uniref:DarT ssDNA thymidine ADP-ribosyltransferase family protein n=1 Tax=Proteus alimentorum TaxID=1973495 RepID=UPI001E4B68CE|nr:DarT ssDNA thymidine ADP-ribosyltransferase family protein [Proteus alimentorum]